VSDKMKTTGRDTHATSHHKLRGYVSWGLIIGLVFALPSAVKAIPYGSEGFAKWLSTPVAALGFLAFFLAAVWYCKLEFDEVVMDYFDGGLRRFALTANRVIAAVSFLIAAFAVAKFAFL